MFQCFENNRNLPHKSFSSHHFFSTIVSPQNSDDPFCLLLIASLATIYLRLETICLILGTESKVCLGKLKKCLNFTRLLCASMCSKKQEMPVDTTACHADDANKTRFYTTYVLDFLLDFFDDSELLRSE